MIVTTPENLHVEDVIAAVTNGVRVIAMQGVQGSGKTHTATALAAKLILEGFSTVIASADEYMMEDGEYKFALSKLGMAHTSAASVALDKYKLNKVIIIDNTNIMQWYLRSYLEPLCQHGFDATKFLVVRCTGTFANIHGVPKDVVDLMRDKIEDLTFDGIMSATPPPPRVPAPAPAPAHVASAAHVTESSSSC